MPFIEFNQNQRTKAGVIFPDVASHPLRISPQSRLEEAIGLALAINLDVVYSEILKIREIKPAAFIGQGVIERIKEVCDRQQIELLIVDASLSPIQQRTLEQKLKIKVIDRTALILEENCR